MSDNSLTQDAQAKYEAKLEPESRPLFSAILSLQKPDRDISKLFQQFIKQHYDKEKEINRHFLQLWSGKYGTIKPLPKWLYSAAIDFLLIYQLDPTQIISIEKIAEHWARQRTSRLKCEATKRLFYELFNPPASKIMAIENVIDTVFSKPDRKSVV